MFKFWKGSQEPVAVKQEEGISYPFFLMAVDKDGNARLTCSLPASSNADAAAFGRALYVLNEGELLESIQKAVIVGGINSRNEAFSRDVLRGLNDSIYNDSVPDDSDEPVVSPTEAFYAGPTRGNKK